MPEDKICINNLKVASFLDDYLHLYLKPECNLFRLDESNWKTIIENEKPGLLLVTSSWYSNIYQLSPSQAQNNIVSGVTALCKKHEIPTVFWVTEDTKFFPRNIKDIRCFDYVFTVNADSIHRYKKVLGHDNIYLILMAAQPKIHNPIDRNKQKLGTAVYVNNLNNPSPELLKDMEMLIKASLEHELHIYETIINSSENSNLLTEYQPYMKGLLAYEQAASIYKKYDLLLYANQFEDSSTAFDKEVFEALACGTNIVASYSPALKNLFPGIVRVCKEPEEVKNCLEMLSEDKNLRDRLSVLGQREIFEKHTYRHRIKEIEHKIGLNLSSHSTPSVSIITCTNKQKYMNYVFDNYERQNYESKELIIVLNSNIMNMEEWKEKSEGYKNVRIFQMDEHCTLGECLNFAIDQSSYDYIAKMDDDDYYGPEYLVDTINAFKFTEAGVVGRYTYFAFFKKSNTLALRKGTLENCYTRSVAGGTVTVRRQVFDKVRFDNLSVGEDTAFFKKCVDNGIKIYSTNRFNYVYMRNAIKQENTWLVEDENLLKNLDIVAVTEDYVPYIQV